MIFSDFSVKHPAIITILLISLLLFGFLALGALNSEMIPSVGLPKAVVVTQYPGAGAREIEREVSRLLENELSNLPGLQEISSSSYDSYSSVQLSFSEETRIYEMVPQIRELLQRLEEELPEGVSGRPVIHIMEASSYLPIFSVRIEGTMGIEELTGYLEDRVEPALARIPGVAGINIVGGAYKEARISLKTAELSALDLSPLEVLEALRYSSTSLPAGRTGFQGNQVSFTTQGSFSSLEELGESAIAGRGERVIRLKDVADLTLIEKNAEVRVRSGEKDYVMMDLLKRDDGDTIFIAEQAERVLQQISRETGGSLEYRVVSDQREMTNNSLQTVIQTALSGLILTIFVILFVLHDLRATIIISLSIPLSMLFSMIGLFLTGRSLNLLSLSGITVSIGMIVDNSIVVLETTHRKFLASGDRKQAALQGAREVGGAILASTSTSISVFAPLLFLTGMIGIIMNGLSLTIVFALAASALTAVVVVPWLSSLILIPSDRTKRPRFLTRIQQRIEGAFAGIEQAYRHLLIKTLDHKVLTVSIASGLFALSLVLLTILELSFIPPADTGEFEIHIRTPQGYTLEQTTKRVDQIDRLVSSLVPEIETAVYYVGAASPIVTSSNPSRAFGRIRLLPTEQRDRRVQEIIPLLQETLSRQIPDSDITILNGGFDSLLALGTGGQGFQMEVYGTDLEDVAWSAALVQELLDKDPDVFKTELSTGRESSQLNLTMERSAMGVLGVTSYQVAMTLRLLFSGVETGSLTMDRKDYPIRLTSDIEGSDVNENMMHHLFLKNPAGEVVPFSAFASLKSSYLPSRIDRKDKNFSIEVRAFLKGEDQSGVTRRINQALAEGEFPPSVQFRTAGTSALIGESFSSLLLMLGVSIFLVYAVMVIQFERFLQPLIIMSSIPLCLIGIVGGLLLFGSAFSIISMLALIALGGIVVNNAIVMVDHINQIRQGDSDSPIEVPAPREPGKLRESIVDGAANRLRPIIMTAMTTMLGVLPMALASGDGSEVYAPLGQAIFGGLFTSTLITLVLVPLLYESLEKRKPQTPG